MKRIVWIVPAWFIPALLLVSLIAVPVLAQQGEMLRAIDSYGPTYKPHMAEDLRLPEPSNLTVPQWGKYDYVEILEAKLVTGEYYLGMVRTYGDAEIFLNKSVDPVATIKARARQMCGVNGTPQSQAELDCLRFYAEIGQRVYELVQVPSYGACRGNVQDQVRTIESGIDSGDMTPIAGALEYSVYATALKWCQARFGQDLTVVPPTPENTIPTFLPGTVPEPATTPAATTPSTTSVSQPINWTATVSYAAAGVLIIIAIFIVVRIIKGRNKRV